MQKLTQYYRLERIDRDDIIITREDVEKITKAPTDLVGLRGEDGEVVVINRKLIAAIVLDRERTRQHQQQAIDETCGQDKDKRLEFIRNNPLLLGRSKILKENEKLLPTA